MDEFWAERVEDVLEVLTHHDEECQVSLVSAVDQLGASIRDVFDSCEVEMTPEAMQGFMLGVECFADGVDWYAQHRAECEEEVSVLRAALSYVLLMSTMATTTWVKAREGDWCGGR